MSEQHSVTDVLDALERELPRMNRTGEYKVEHITLRSREAWGDLLNDHLSNRGCIKVGKWAGDDDSHAVLQLRAKRKLDASEVPFQGSGRTYLAACTDTGDEWWGLVYAIPTLEHFAVPPEALDEMVGRWGGGSGE